MIWLILLILLILINFIDLSDLFDFIDQINQITVSDRRYNRSMAGRINLHWRSNIGLWIRYERIWNLARWGIIVLWSNVGYRLIFRLIDWSDDLIDWFGRLNDQFDWLIYLLMWWFGRFIWLLFDWLIDFIAWWLIWILFDWLIDLFDRLIWILIDWLIDDSLTDLFIYW